jgi:hypothetical protein
VTYPTVSWGIRRARVSCRKSFITKGLNTRCSSWPECLTVDPHFPTLALSRPLISHTNLESGHLCDNCDSMIGDENDGDNELLADLLAQFVSIERITPLDSPYLRTARPWVRLCLELCSPRLACALLVTCSIEPFARGWLCLQLGVPAVLSCLSRTISTRMPLFYTN